MSIAKLKFIEKGRMEKSSLEHFRGGAWVTCSTHTVCDPETGPNNKSHCTNYESCINEDDKNNCSSYYYVVNPIQVRETARVINQKFMASNT
jgi:hypothetical protein